MTQTDEILARLRAAYGEAWSFDIAEHKTTGANATVVGVLEAGGTRIRESGSANGEGRSLGERLDIAAARSLSACAATLLGETAVAPPPPLAEPQPEPAPTMPKMADPGKPLPPRPTKVTDYAYDSLDPVTLRVVGGAFDAIAKEMAHVLYRMSYSSIIRESEDLGCGIFDIEGAELCESDSTPMHIGSLPWYIRGMHKRLKGRINEGDIIIHNHPYFGASNTPDLAVITPIFRKGRMLGFAACTAHLLDVGGAAPGINVDVVDVYAEAKLFNAVKLHDKGRRNEEVWQLIKDNVRTPDMDSSDRGHDRRGGAWPRPLFRRGGEIFARDRDGRRKVLDGLFRAHAAGRDRQGARRRVPRRRMARRRWQEP